MTAEKDTIAELLEAKYKTSGWGRNVWEDQAQAVLDNYIVIAKTDLPGVKRSVAGENCFLVDNDNVVFTSAENGRRWVLRDVAVWQFLAHEEAVLADQAARQAAARLTARRNELAAEFTAVNSYGGQLPYTQKLIDRIIELEGAAK